MTRPALFLDRDGVINVDHGYIYQKENFEFIDGIFDLCHQAKRFGYYIFIITNQAGIGRGYYTEQDFFQLTTWMSDQFNQQGIIIDKVYFCPDHPEHGIGKYKKTSMYRKPQPGMILEAATDFKIDLSKSFLVGDKESDIQAGINAGIGHNVLFRAEHLSTPTAADQVVYELREITLTSLL